MSVSWIKFPSSLSLSLRPLLLVVQFSNGPDGTCFQSPPPISTLHHPFWHRPFQPTPVSSPPPISTPHHPFWHRPFQPTPVSTAHIPSWGFFFISVIPRQPIPPFYDSYPPPLLLRVLYICISTGRKLWWWRKMKGMANNRHWQRRGRRATNDREIGPLQVSFFNFYLFLFISVFSTILVTMAVTNTGMSL